MSNAPSRTIALFVQGIVAVAICPLPAGATADERVADTVSEFVGFVQAQATYPDSAKSFIQQEWQRRRASEDQRTFIPEALAVLHPRFKKGLDAYAARQFEFACGSTTGARIWRSSFFQTRC